MPNIHLFIDQTSDDGTYRRVVLIVQRALTGLGLQSDGVITPHNVRPMYTNDDFTYAPYVAVSSTNADEALMIVGALQALCLDLDCEIWPTLRRFIPAEEMRS